MKRTMRLPDGRRVTITVGDLPRVVRKRASHGAGHGMTEVLRSLKVGEVAKVPAPDGFNGRLISALRGVVANYERYYDARFEMRSHGDAVLIRREEEDGA